MLTIRWPKITALKEKKKLLKSKTTKTTEKLLRQGEIDRCYRKNVDQKQMKRIYKNGTRNLSELWNEENKYSQY